MLQNVKGLSIARIWYVRACAEVHKIVEGIDAGLPTLGYLLFDELSFESIVLEQV